MTQKPLQASTRDRKPQLGLPKLESPPDHHFLLCDPVFPQTLGPGQQWVLSQGRMDLCSTGLGLEPLVAKPGCPLAGCLCRVFAQGHSHISASQTISAAIGRLWELIYGYREVKGDATPPASHGQREFKILCPKCAFRTLHPGPGMSLPSAKSLPAGFVVLRSSGSSQSCLSLPGHWDPAGGGTMLLFVPRAPGDVSVQLGQTSAFVWV